MYNKLNLNYQVREALYSMQSIIKLKHKPDLKYRQPVESRGLIALIQEDINVVISFDELGIVNETIEVDALDIPHIFNLKNTDNIAVVNLESHSQLYPIIYWYLLHQLGTGNTVQVVEQNSRSLQIEKKYFKDSFELISTDGISRVYKKTRPLLVEESKGLDDWSFCIPTGPGDATLLNNLVRQILEYELPYKEILLCGKPGENFQYWDDVRIVGEDIPAPPVHITKKKNVLAQEAKYQNLCILHDRVLLPNNFVEAIHKMEDLYPLTAFQSICMVDRLGLLPMRYSDFNCLIGQVKKGWVNQFNKKEFDASINMVNFAYYTPNTFPLNSYATGSLYIVKKKLWSEVPQEETLFWADFEDVEYGIRLAEYGIPTIANPYTLSYSQRARTVIVGMFALACYKGPGMALRVSRVNRFALLSLPMKSVLGDFETYKKNIDRYVDEYAIDLSYMLSKNISRKKHFLLISKLIFLTKISRSKEFFERWYADICKYLFLEQTHRLEGMFLERVFMDNSQSDYDIKLQMISHFWNLKVQIFQSVFSPIFTQKEEREPKYYKFYSFFVASRILKSKDYSLRMGRSSLSSVLNGFMRVSNGN